MAKDVIVIYRIHKPVFEKLKRYFSYRKIQHLFNVVHNFNEALLSWAQAFRN